MFAKTFWFRARALFLLLIIGALSLGGSQIDGCNSPATNDVVTGSSGSSACANNIAAIDTAYPAFTPPSLSQGLHFEGEGQVFQIANPIFPNLRLESSEPIKLIAEAITNTLSFLISPLSTTNASQTTLTISGLEPFWTGKGEPIPLFRHENGFFIEEFKVNAEGKYSWVQGLDKDRAKHIYILPSKGTINIWGRYDPRDDVVSKGIGVWLDATTCQLTQDISNDFIVIQADNLTLDGNNHTLSVPGYGYGIYLYGRSGVTVKNYTVHNGNYGAGLYYCPNCTLTKCIFDGQFYTGLWLYGGSGYTVSYSTFNNSAIYGLVVAYTTGANVHHNTVANNQDCIQLSSYANYNTINANICFNCSGPGVGVSYGSVGNSILNNQITGCLYGAYVGEGSNSATACGNNISGCGYGFWFNYTSGHIIYHNNAYNNSTKNVYSSYNIQLSSNGEGNWWGHNPGEPLFTEGVDSNMAGVTDSFPYAYQSAWRFGIPIGTPPGIAAAQPNTVIKIFPVGLDPKQLAVAPAFYPADQLKGYVFNQGEKTTLSILDLIHNTATGKIDLSAQTTYIANLTFTPDAKYLYVLHQGYSIIDVATDRVIQTVPYPGKWFSCLAFSPDGKYLYAGIDAGVPGYFLYIIETATNNLVGQLGQIPLMDGFQKLFPQDIAVTPDGRRAYLTHPYNNLNRVSVVDLATRCLTGTISGMDGAGTGMYDIEINRAGTKAYVTAPDMQYLYEIDLTQNPTYARSIWLHNKPLNVTLTPDDKYAYVSTKQNSYSVKVIDLTTEREVANIPVGTPMYCPAGLGITPDGYDCYVASETDNAVYVIPVKPHLAQRLIRIDTIVPEAGLAFPGAYFTVNGSGFSTVAAENTVHIGIESVASVVNPTGTTLNAQIPYDCCFGTHSVWVETPWGTSNPVPLYVQSLSGMFATNGPVISTIYSLYYLLGLTPPAGAAASVLKVTAGSSGAKTNQPARNLLDTILRQLVGEGTNGQNDMLTMLKNGNNVAGLERIEQAIRLLEQFEQETRIDTALIRKQLYLLAQYITRQLIMDAQSLAGLTAGDLDKINQAQALLTEGITKGNSGDYLGALYYFKTAASIIASLKPTVEIGSPYINFVSEGDIPNLISDKSYVTPDYLGKEQSVTVAFKIEVINKDIMPVYVRKLYIEHTLNRTAIQFGNTVLPSNQDSVSIPLDPPIVLDANNLVVTRTIIITGTGVSSVWGDAWIHLSLWYTYDEVPIEKIPACAARVTVVDVYLKSISFIAGGVNNGGDNEYPINENSTDASGWGDGPVISDPVWIDNNDDKMPEKNQPACYLRSKENLDSKVKIGLGIIVTPSNLTYNLVANENGKEYFKIAGQTSTSAEQTLFLLAGEKLPATIEKLQKEFTWEVHIMNSTYGIDNLVDIIPTTHTIYVIYDAPVLTVEGQTNKLTPKRLEFSVISATGQSDLVTICDKIVGKVRSETGNSYGGMTEDPRWKFYDRTNRNLDCHHRAALAASAFGIVGIKGYVMQVFATCDPVPSAPSGWAANPTVNDYVSTYLGDKLKYRQPETDIHKLWFKDNHFEGCIRVEDGSADDGNAWWTVWPRKQHTNAKALIQWYANSQPQQWIKLDYTLVEDNIPLPLTKLSDKPKILGGSD